MTLPYGNFYITTVHGDKHLDKGRVHFSHIGGLLTQPFMSWGAFSDQVNCKLGSFEDWYGVRWRGSGQREKDKKDKFKEWQ